MKHISSILLSFTCIFILSACGESRVEIVREILNEDSRLSDHGMELKVREDENGAIELTLVGSSIEVKNALENKFEEGKDLVETIADLNAAATALGSLTELSEQLDWGTLEDRRRSFESKHDNRVLAGVTEDIKVLSNLVKDLESVDGIGKLHFKIGNFNPTLNQYSNPEIMAAEDFTAETSIEDLEGEYEKGNARAAAILSILHRRGYGVKVDQQKSFRLASESAEDGDLIGLYSLAKCYDDAVGVEFSGDKSDELAERAVELGGVDSAGDDPWSQYVAGKLLDGTFETEKDLSLAVEFFRRSSAMNLPLAKTSLGICFYWGNGVNESEDRAIELLESASDAGDPFAKAYLGLVLYRQDGGPEKETEAFKLIASAAESGNPFAMKELGFLYLYGDGVSQDAQRGLMLLEAAGDAGEAWGYFEAGKVYLMAQFGIEQDAKKAADLFGKAVLHDLDGGRFGVGFIWIMNAFDSYDGKNDLTDENAESLFEGGLHFWNDISEAYWAERVADDFPFWESLEPEWEKKFRRLDVSLPWERSNDRNPKGIANASSPQSVNKIGPALLGIQIGDDIENAAGAFNREYTETIDGEKLRVAKMPVGGDYVCSNEEGIKGMLQRDNARSDTDAAINQLLLDEMGPLASLLGAGGAEDAGAPIIFADEDGVIVKYVFTPSYVSRAFASQYSSSNRQFVSFLKSKFNLPFLESEIVETSNLFGEKGFENRYFGFTTDGVSVEIKVNKTVIVKKSD